MIDTVAGLAVPQAFWSVAALVVAIFALTAVAIVVVNRRRRPEGATTDGAGGRTASARRSLWPRWRSWVWGALVLLGCLAAGRLAFGALLALLAFQAARELRAVLGAMVPQTNSGWAVAAVASAMPLGAGVGGAPGALVVGGALPAVAMGLLIARQREPDATQAAALLGSFGLALAVGAPLALLVTTADGVDGFARVAWFLLVVVAFDTASMFGGLAFGRHRLAPALSPGKTVEGTLAGFVGAIAVGAVLAAQFPSASPWMYHAAAMAVSCGALSGDLSASWVKRAAHSDAYGSSLPGHGGVMDRIDSWLGAAFVFAVLVHGGVFG